MCHRRLPQQKGQNLDRDYNSKGGCLYVVQLLRFVAKLPTLILKTWHQVLLSSLLLAFAPHPPMEPIS